MLKLPMAFLVEGGLSPFVYILPSHHLLIPVPLYIPWHPRGSRSIQQSSTTPPPKTYTTYSFIFWVRYVTCRIPTFRLALDLLHWMSLLEVLILSRIWMLEDECKWLTVFGNWVTFWVLMVAIIKPIFELIFVASFRPSFVTNLQTRLEPVTLFGAFAI
ncbi:uncharacterized protein BDR25DRAFT_360586 [Lindgomyces ingoldianus]|uniref:Uncharacterized protein n=1 Tax=Lindgomyces ingoldianus TaxID=673940 RepID=A0ACB6QGF9_9PLEO|nr:uncharacterized protein BDR25DRAFT_360586 [Lindgomyces ingoldianus]KAF2465653.1 hypothetical protein BDR25DRAFT_360586 [Lindgomyces ingoldianus]